MYVAGRHVFQTESRNSLTNAGVGHNGFCGTRVTARLEELYVGLTDPGLRLIQDRPKRIFNQGGENDTFPATKSLR